MKKTIAVIAIISIVFGALAGWVVPAHALSETVLSVTGQLLLDVPMLSSIFSIALNPMGLTPNLIAKAQAEGANVVDVLETMIRSYAETHNLPISHLLNVTKNGLSYDTDGKLYWNEALSGLLSSFAAWAYSADGGALVNYDVGQPGGDVEVDYSNVDTSQLFNPSNIQSLNLTTGTVKFMNSSYVTYSVESGTYITFFKVSNAYTVFCFSDSPATVTMKQYSGGSVSSTSTSNLNAITRNGLTFYADTFYGNYCRYIVEGPVSTMTTYSNSNETLWDICYLIYNGRVVGESNVDTNIFDLPQDNSKDTNLVDPNELVYVPDFGSAVGSVSTDIQSWIEATRDTILNGSSDLTITDTNGISSTVETDTTGTTTMQVIQTITTTLPPVTDVADETITGNIGQYSLDLRDYFPFCIPFDVFRILRLFNGSAQAPRVTWRFYVPNIVDYDIVIDLSPFDSVASILRTMELISFCLGLAFVSKKLLFGS